jgi:hypothetical protein
LFATNTEPAIASSATPETYEFTVSIMC